MLFVTNAGIVSNIYFKQFFVGLIKYKCNAFFISLKYNNEIIEK